VIVCWKDHFLRIGGFDEGLQVRENSDLIWRLKDFGAYKYIGEVAATTSMRRYEQSGSGEFSASGSRFGFRRFSAICTAGAMRP